MFSGDVVGEGLFALAAAVLAISYQFYQFRKQLVRAHDDEIAAQKKRIIENLIAYRSVLIGERQNDPAPTMQFNAALSAVPVHFSRNADCMAKYRAIGDSFTPEKFYDLMMALMRDVPLDVSNFDQALLENVPRVTPKIGLS